MDSQLPNNLTQGSAILGYGETKRSYVKYVAAFFAAVFLSAIGAFVAWALLSPFSLPAGTLATIALPGKTYLPDSTPNVWRKAALSGSPIMLGLARSGKGLEYFAVEPRWVASDDATSISSGLLKTVFAGAEIPTIKEHPATSFFSQALLKARGNSAFLTLWPEQDTTRKPISGNIKDSQWKTDLAVSTINDDIVLEGDNYIDLRALPEAWTTVSPTLMDRFALDIRQIPDAIGWDGIDKHDPSLKLVFTEPLNDETLDELYAAAGQTKTANYRLADGSVVPELLTPDATEDKARINSLGMPLEVTLTGNNLIFQKYIPTETKTSCGERRIAAIDTESLPTSIPELRAMQERRAKLIFSVDRGNLLVCYQVINK